MRPKRKRDDAYGKYRENGESRETTDHRKRSQHKMPPGSHLRLPSSDRGHDLFCYVYLFVVWHIFFIKAFARLIRVPTVPIGIRKISLISSYDFSSRKNKDNGSEYKRGICERQLLTLSLISSLLRLSTISSPLSKSASSVIGTSCLRFARTFMASL